MAELGRQTLENKKALLFRRAFLLGHKDSNPE